MFDAVFEASGALNCASRKSMALDEDPTSTQNTCKTTVLKGTQPAGPWCGLVALDSQVLSLSGKE